MGKSMALYICCRYTLVSLSVLILLTGAAMMFDFGYELFTGGADINDVEGVNETDIKGGVLLGFGLVAVLLFFVVIWLGCCLHRGAAMVLFISGLTLIVVFLLCTSSAMLTFGMLHIIYMNSGGDTLRGALLLSFSVVPLAAAIGVPFYCRRRLRQFQREEERNEAVARPDGNITQSVVPPHDDKEPE